MKQLSFELELRLKFLFRPYPFSLSSCTAIIIFFLVLYFVGFVLFFFWGGGFFLWNPKNINKPRGLHELVSFTRERRFIEQLHIIAYVQV